MRQSIIGLLTGLWIILSFYSAYADDPLFAAKVDYPVGAAPYSIFSADLDGDDDYDLITANYGSSNVSVLKNNGDGTFAADVVYSVGSSPTSVFSINFDYDDDCDLAVANFGSDNISILTNYGDGTFAAPANYDAGDYPYSVFSTDFNGDGFNDLAVAHGGTGSVTWMLNTCPEFGCGLAGPVYIYMGGAPVSIFAADFDNDTDQDLVVAHDEYSGHVSVFKNNGNGTFASALHYEAGIYSVSVFSADLDGDTDFDLAVANCGSSPDYIGGVLILKNNGNGTFAPATYYSAGSGPWSVFSADFDGDEDYDLALADSIDDVVLILKNNGNGSFAPADIYGVGENPVSVCSADFDGDGDYDLATANLYDNNVSVLINLSGPYYICGDFDGQPGINILDVVHLINYIYKNGAEPIPLEAAEMDGLPGINILDVVRLINYLYKNGPEPDCP